LLHELKIKE
jgi:hypothetical protein